MPVAPLPIDAILPALVAALRAGPSAVLRAPTGVGKTTRVPPAILDAGLAGGGAVLVLEPRRLAARAAARRMARERGAELGGEVGFHVRFDRRAGARTRLLVVTEGILVRRLQDDPFLEGVGALVFDEFHERSLESDLALAMARRVQREVRPELRIVAMSATLVPERLAAFLGGCPVIESEGRLFPIETSWLEREERAPVHRLAAAGVARALERTGGDVLVFLPGVGEIRRTADELRGLAERRGIELLELYGDLPMERQDAVLEPRPGRKVVLATNVAQTSVTVPGVTAVVDTGLARTLRFDAGVGLDRLELGRISKASADQRAGRAGRTAPGVCLRLWTEAAHRSLADEDEPEIRRVDLAGPCLQLACWGESDVASLGWLEPPPAAALARARELLDGLGAADARGPTEIGRAMARLPLHPRLARLVVAGHRLGHPEPAALAAALLAERDPFRRAAGRAPARHESDSDVLDRAHALEDFEREGRTRSAAGELDTGAARFLLRARDQLLREVERALGPPPRTDRPADRALLRALAVAYADRVVRRRAPGDPRGVMASGRGVRLADESAVTGAELFVAVSLDAGRRGERAEALVRLASAVRLEWFDGERVNTDVELAFDAERETVTAVRRTRLDRIVIEEAPVGLPDSERVAAVLADAASPRLDRALALDGEAVRSFLERARSLREWMPELELPAFDDAELRAILPELCRGRRSFTELRAAPLLESLRGRLSWKQLQALEREAPERLAVPSGSEIRLRYEPGRPPVLAARIQELFGLAETPRVAAGRVPVLLHLLAPNMRPQQVTDDLASFWNGAYALVRKELRARYPKHAWPEDPWNAAPERRPRRRR